MNRRCDEEAEEKEAHNRKKQEAQLEKGTQGNNEISNQPTVTASRAQ
jgi:hypothetical protein